MLGVSIHKCFSVRALEKLFKKVRYHRLPHNSASCAFCRWRWGLHTSQMADGPENISSPPQPGWDASPSPLTGLPPALQLPVPICTPGWRDTVKVMCLAQEKNAMSVLQPQSDLKMSALTMRTLCLTHRKSLAQMESNVNWIVSIVDQRIQLHCLIIINIFRH